MLSMTITDPLTLATFSKSWAINIPATVFGNTAWVGFTGSTGANTASQKVTSWTYLTGPPAVPQLSSRVRFGESRHEWSDPERKRPCNWPTE